MIELYIKIELVLAWIVIAFSSIVLVRFFWRLYKLRKAQSQFPPLVQEPMQTFPHRDVAGADAEAGAMLADDLNKLFWSYNELCDQAFHQKDFKGHAVFAMAANKLTILKNPRRSK